MNYIRFIGIDVSKEWFDVALAQRVAGQEDFGKIGFRNDKFGLIDDTLWDDNLKKRGF